jgi:hypothetical protein
MDRRVPERFEGVFHFASKDIFLPLNVRIERSPVGATACEPATEGESADERNN